MQHFGVLIQNAAFSSRSCLPSLASWLSSGMEIKLGRFLHTVPIVRIGKFCKSPLGLLWVGKGLVNKLFRFDPEGLANRCWLGPYFEGVYCIFMS